MSVTSLLYWRDKFQRAQLKAKVSIIDPLVVACPFSTAAEFDYDSLKLPVQHLSMDPAKPGELFETVHYPELNEVLNATKKFKGRLRAKAALSRPNQPVKAHPLFGKPRPVQTPQIKIRGAINGRVGKKSPGIMSATLGVFRKDTRPKFFNQQFSNVSKQIQLAPFVRSEQQNEHLSRGTHGTEAFYTGQAKSAAVPTPNMIQREFAKYGLAPFGKPQLLCALESQDEFDALGPADRIEEVESLLPVKKVHTYAGITKKPFKGGTGGGRTILKSLVSNVSPPLKSAFAKTTEVVESTTKSWQNPFTHTPGNSATAVERPDTNGSRHVRFTESVGNDTSSMYCFECDGAQDCEMEDAPFPVGPSVDSSQSYNTDVMTAAAPTPVQSSSTPFTSPLMKEAPQGNSNLSKLLLSLASHTFTSPSQQQLPAWVDNVHPQASHLEQVCGNDYSTAEMDDAVMEYLVATNLQEPQEQPKPYATYPFKVFKRGSPPSSA